MGRLVPPIAAGLWLCGIVAATGATGRFDAVRQLPATEWEAKGGGAKAFWCPLVSQGPRLDGRIDDPCWQAAGKAHGFIKADGGMALAIPADYTTQVLACRDPENLYMAWIVKGDMVHQTIAEVSGNVMLKRTIVSMIDLLRRASIQLILEGKRKPSGIHFHRAILEAILAGNEDEAVSLMRQDLMIIKDLIVKR